MIAFPIVTERLLIRPTVEADATALHAAWGDPAVMSTPTASHHDTLALLRAKMAQQERDGFSMWTVEERPGGAIVGTVGLQYEDGPDVGLGFLFAPSAWGRGYGRESCRAVLRAGFDQLGLSRIVGITDRDNGHARRLMEAIGMAHRGPARYYGRDWELYDAVASPEPDPPAAAVPSPAR